MNGALDHTTPSSPVNMIVRIVRNHLDLRDGVILAQTLRDQLDTHTVYATSERNLITGIADFLEEAANVVANESAVALPAWLAMHMDTEGWRMYVITQAVLPVALAKGMSVDGAVVAFHDVSTLERNAAMLQPCCIEFVCQAAPRLQCHRARSALCCAILHLHEYNPSFVNASERIAQMLLDMTAHDKAVLSAFTALKEMDGVCTACFARIGIERCVALLQDMHSTTRAITRTAHTRRAECTELISLLLARHATMSCYRAFHVRLRVLPVVAELGFPEECFLVVANAVVNASHLIPLTESVRLALLSIPHMTERWEALRAKLSAPRPRCVPSERAVLQLDGVHDAVIASDGHTYDRAVLEALLTSESPRSLVTREPLHPWIASNHALRG